MLKLFICLIFLTTNIVRSEQYVAQFPKKTWVKLLRDDNFDNTTHIGKQPLQKPWFILFYASWCVSCTRIITLWENIEKKYNKKINIGAVNGEKNLQIRDRFVVTTYPTAIFFNGTNMYYFEDLYTEEDLSSFLDKRKWQHQKAYDIPTEISYVRVYIAKLTSPIMVKLSQQKQIPVFIIVSFIVFLTFILVQDRKYEQSKKDEAKKIKEMLVQRQTEKLSQKVKNDYINRPDLVTSIPIKDYDTTISPPENNYKTPKSSNRKLQRQQIQSDHVEQEQQIQFFQTQEPENDNYFSDRRNEKEVEIELTNI